MPKIYPAKPWLLAEAMFVAHLGSSIRNLIQVASKVVPYAGQKVIKIASGWPWSQALLELLERQMS